MVEAMDFRQQVKCNNSYVPNSEEYLTALGAYGTAVLVYGGLVTVGLYILFFEQVLFTHQNAHDYARRHIYWISSMCPLMSLLSVVALVIPRAHSICTAVKVTYMSIGITHFVDLTKVMFGGEEGMLVRGDGTTINLRQRPMCCCCKCLPSPPVSKFSMRMVVLLANQLPFTQAMYYVFFLIISAASDYSLGELPPAGPFLWLNIFKLTTCMLGVYGLMILANYSQDYLENFDYKRKSFSIRMLVLVVNFMGFILNIMASYNAFPCLSASLSPLVYKQTVENSLYLLAMMLLGPYTYLQYHNLQFSTPIEPCCKHMRAEMKASKVSYDPNPESASTSSGGARSDHTTITVAEREEDREGLPRPAAPTTENHICEGEGSAATLP